MTIGQEQLMKLKVGVGERSWSCQLKTPTKSFAWKIIEFAFNLWQVAVVGICAWIAIFG